MILITDANYLATGVRAKGRRYDDTTERLNDWANGRRGEGAKGGRGEGDDTTIRLNDDTTERLNDWANGRRGEGATI